MQAKFQKLNNDWTGEDNVTIPFNRVNKSEKIKERHASKLFTESIKINKLLQGLAAMVQEANKEITTALADEKKLKAGKGNYTWYNFDKSVKIETDVNEMVQFDAALIATAREKLEKFIEANVQGTDDIIRQLINSSFQSSRGGLDNKKVLGLMKYRSKIKDHRFQEALDLIEQSISRPSSKRYVRIWVKGDDGQYENIGLNFSNI